MFLPTSPSLRVLFLLGFFLGVGVFARSTPFADEDQPAFWQVIERTLEEKDLTEPATVVLKHMDGLLRSRLSVKGRIERVDRALTEPWTPPQLADELRALLSAPLEDRKALSFDSLWPDVAGYIDLELTDPADLGVLEDLDLQLEYLHRPGLEGMELLESLSTFLGDVHRAAQEALSGLTEEQSETLFKSHVAFREAWYRNHFPGEAISDEQQATLAKWIGLLREASYDRGLALAIAARVASLADPALRDTLMKRLRRVNVPNDVEGFEGDVRAVVGDEPSNRVVLGGRGKTTYTAPAALIIDLAGNDIYRRAAVVDSPEMLVSVVIDLKGNDRYEGTPGAATATGGIAVLADIEGDDTHACGRLGQAAATFGVAWLLDLEGNDSYGLEDYGQGHAIAGSALLYDIEGDDSYDAWAFAQGGGIAYGFSALVDGEGDDTYLADLHWPDVYGNSGPNIYHGASQGYSTGLRDGGGVAGGVAALIDLGDGSDRYQSGNFSQGGAYFFSFALMYDDGGDDENFGTRYSQGFGVHQAAAVRWDHGGNDAYTCRSVAHTGMAWDEGVGYFLEDEGNDTYNTGGLSLGGAAQTGVAVCIDGGGTDSYQSKSASQGGTGSSEYHDKPALGVLIDLGGGEDSYSRPERKNGKIRTSDGVELFIDSKAKTIEDLLDRMK
jgi:hypothetical protein